MVKSLQDRQREETVKLNKKFRDMSDRNNATRLSLTYKQELSRQLSASRMRENKLKMEQQKVMLDCIKERIWRKHKKVQARRARQQQQTAPPSTFDIYMANSSVMSNPMSPSI